MEKQRQSKNEITYIVSDCGQPFHLDQKFDVVTAFFLFENAPTKGCFEHMVSNISDWTKPNGRLVVLTINPEYPSSRLRKLKKFGIEYIINDETYGKDEANF